MIEEVSFPADLALWDSADNPFYLELFGETRPVVDMHYAELVPFGSSEASTRAITTHPTPIYQYWWTIGHDGNPQSYHDLWSQLSDDAAARVYLFFPLDRGWRIKELAATVKYLLPFHEQLSLWSKAAQIFHHDVEPVAAGMGSLLETLKALPPVAGAGALLEQIARLQVNSIPPVEGFTWSVRKVTTAVRDHGVMQGVLWTLPKKMFTDLGGRLTGELALSFIPSQAQQGDAVAAHEPVLSQGSILAHAVVLTHDHRSIWAPGEGRFIALQIHPRIPLEDH
jgi:hypothetical protein